MERLYQPDFSSIFGTRYANAFIYGQIDTLIWPIFSDIGRSNALKSLLDPELTLNGSETPLKTILS